MSQSRFLVIIFTSFLIFFGLQACDDASEDQMTNNATSPQVRSTGGDTMVDDMITAGTMANDIQTSGSVSSDMTTGGTMETSPPIAGEINPATDQPEDNDAACSDGIDNDGDGFLDCDDYDCSRSDDVTVCGGGGTSPTGDPENTDALCSDNVDNDGDGFIDCEDYDCSRSDLVTVCP